MDHVIKTGLDVETQKTTLDQAFAEQTKKYPQYSPTFKWTGETEGLFSFKPTPSMEIEGKVLVSENEIGIKFTKLPFLAKMFKGKAIELVEKEVQVWVEKAKAAPTDAPQLS